MFFFLLNILPFRKTGEFEQYKTLLSTNYPFLKRACVQVVRWHGGGMDDAVSDEAEYLLGRVLEHFMEDDYRRLRGSEIRNVKTFFRNCIENLFKDILAKKHGKDRGKERARELGPLGLRVYELLSSGHSIDAIHALLASTDETLSWEEVYRTVQRIKGSNALPPTDGNQVVQASGDEGDDPDPSDFDVVDNRPDPEQVAIERRKHELRQQVLKDLDDLLDDEGKVMIRLYYLEQDTRKCTVADVARYLGKTPKAADHKLRRILDGFREYLMRKGLRPDDFL